MSSHMRHKHSREDVGPYKHRLIMQFFLNKVIPLFVNMFITCSMHIRSAIGMRMMTKVDYAEMDNSFLSNTINSCHKSTRILKKSCIFKVTRANKNKAKIHNTSGEVLMHSCLVSFSLLASSEPRSASHLGVSSHELLKLFPAVLLNSIQADMPFPSMPPHSSQKHFQSFSVITVNPSV